MDNQRRLAAWVIVNGQAYGPDHDLPADIAARITNPNAWPPDTDPPRQPETSQPAGPQPPAEGSPGTEAADPPSAEPPDTAAGTDDPPPPPVEVAPPPRSGKGSGLDAWQAYAHAMRVDVPEGAERGDIITACEKAGHLPPT